MLKPGDRSELVNECASAIRVTIRFQDGTEIAVSLHPGAQIDIKAGDGPGEIAVILTDVEGPQHLRAIGGTGTQHRLRRRIRPVSPIDRDPELGAFLRMGADTMTLEQLRAACADHFGSDRTPSRSAIHRFLNRPSKGFPRLVEPPENVR